MEKYKKVIVVDSATALVICENTEGNFLMSQHRNWSRYCEDYDQTLSGTSHSLYTLSKRQASILMKKEPSSKIFQYTLNKVKKKNEINDMRLNSETKKVFEIIVDDDDKLAQAALKERGAYLEQERQKREQEEELADKQAKDAFSQKFLDYVKGFRTK
ncbi:MAG: hypothetical protein J5896_06540 [Alphaproteobacteria bacterium]|nr:hypothetical protein [Alphaproteobacteria bacterium]